MGVPSFYRWLINKYPKAVSNAIEEEHIDTSLPNPNGFEFDNLYLDMNGIIHPCFHPQDDNDFISPPITFEDVFDNMFGYIDRIFSIIRPRKLLYMAIDGVAPRAKMNQQRARRFRNARDEAIAEEEESKVQKEFEREGKLVLPREEYETSDSNIITPGTVFMHKLSKALGKYINLRLSSDPGWKNIKVILSDANVPGEGEHKVMSFIRSQRAQPSYDPNTRHCLYGLDADLIMLALATHEIHFSILREDMLIQEQNNISYKQVSDESSPNKSRGWLDNTLRAKPNQGSNVPRKPYQLLHVWILREYLSLDTRILDPPKGFKFDLERIIDDFVFMCFFVGNDFLPHNPSLSIHENAIDLLMSVYKKEMKNIGGYMVDMSRVDDKKAGYIKLSRVEKFILSVAAFEDKIFTKRTRLTERKLKQLCSEAMNEGEEGSSFLLPTEVEEQATEREDHFKKAVAISKSLSCGDANSDYVLLKNTKELKEKVKSNIRIKSDLFKSRGFGNDKVRLGSPGYRDRYYKEKFGAENSTELESTRKTIVEKYTEGLLWVLSYYFSGPPSWTWHYPFYHGPFLSDLKGLSQIKVKFNKDLPFKPFNQLLSVLPPRSVQALPKSYQALMYENSPIFDFYPEDFEIDMDGKRFTWQGICKLPFIDEKRLLVETNKLENDLEVEELDRNSEKFDQLVFHRTHNVASNILSVTAEKNEIKTMEKLKLSDEICGYIRLPYMDSDQEDPVMYVLYELPDYSPHLPRILDGVKCPEMTIREDDVEETQLWHEYFGAKPTHKYNNMEQSFGDSCRISDSRGRGISRGRQRFGTENRPSYDQAIYKGGGSGWSTIGRGQPRRDDYYYDQSNEGTGNRSSRGFRGGFSNDRHGSSGRGFHGGSGEFRAGYQRSDSNNTNQYWERKKY